MAIQAEAHASKSARRLALHLWGGNLFGAGVAFWNGLAVISAPNTLKDTSEGEVTLYKLVNGSWVSTGVLYAPNIPGSSATSNIGFKM